MKKLLLILFLGMLLVIPVVSAARIDYSPNDKGVNDMKAHVKDTILFGLIQIGEQGTMELKSHKTPTEIIDVSPGWDVTMKYELNFNELISYGLGDVYFIDLRTGKEVEREYKFVYWGTEERSREVCIEETQVKSLNSTNVTSECIKYGTETYTYEGWLDYTSKDIPKGKITLGLMVNNKVNDYIDGVWEVAGKKLTKHAGWTASLDNGLVSWYSLDETSGTTAFDSLGRNNGTNNGATINQAGKVNRSYDFERDNGNYISLPSGVATSIGSGSFSISMWINPETSLSGTQYTVLLWNNPGSANEFRIHYYNGVLFFATIRSEEGWISAEKTISLNAGSWYYITATYNSSTKKQNIYVNAITGTEATRATATNAFSGTTYLGKQDTTTTTNPDEFDGKIDEVAIWNRALTTDEIALLYNNGDGLGYREEFVGVTSLSPIDNFNSSSKDITFIGNTTQESVTNFSLIIDDVYEQTNTSGLSGNYTFTETLDDGVYSWKFESCNASECMNSTARTLTVDSTAPTIDLLSPNSTFNYLQEGSTLYLTGFANDTNLDTVWYEYNGTNTTFSATTATLFNESITQADSSKLSLTLWANDTIGNVNSETVSWEYRVFQNNNTFNASTYETASETFSVNLTANASLTAVTLDYNGTDYAMTKSGTVYSKTLDIPEGISNRTLRYKLTYAEDTIYSDYFYQDVALTYFTLCNATYTTPFLNISFKDEANLAVLNATIPTSTFIYYLGTGTVNKTLTYINNTENYYYQFCATPTDRNLTVDPYLQYKQGLSYPQRIWNPDAQTYSNVTTNETLYLLGTGGQYVTIQVTNQADQLISGVTITVERIIDGETVEVGKGTTGDDGTFTFWLNPDFSHTFTLTKEGYTTTSSSFLPTQSSYTFTLGESYSAPSSYTRGMVWILYPQNSSLTNDTIYNFGMKLTSNYWDLDSFGFDLRLVNGTIITGTTSTTSGTTITIAYNTTNQSRIFIDYYWIVEGNTSSGSAEWRVYSTEYTQWSVRTFFDDFNAYLDSGLFGIDDFGRYLLIFLIIFLTVGILGYKIGYTNPLFVTGLIFFVIFFFDVAVGLIPSLSIAGGREVPYLLTIISGLIFVVSIISEGRQ